MVGLIDRLDMTIVVDWDIKPQIKQTKLNAVVGVYVLFQFDVLDRMWNSIISVPDHCFVI